MVKTTLTADKLFSAAKNNDNGYNHSYTAHSVWLNISGTGVEKKGFLPEQHGVITFGGSDGGAMPDGFTGKHRREIVFYLRKVYGTDLIFNVIRGTDENGGDKPEGNSNVGENLKVQISMDSKKWHDSPWIDVGDSSVKNDAALTAARAEGDEKFLMTWRDPFSRADMKIDLSAVHTPGNELYVKVFQTSTNWGSFYDSYGLYSMEYDKDIPPTISKFESSSSIITLTSVTQTQNINFTIDANDNNSIDNVKVLFGATIIESNLTLTDGKYTFTRTYQYDDYNVGSQQETYQVQVTDNAGLQTNKDLTITINKVNSAPKVIHFSTKIMDCNKKCVIKNFTEKFIYIEANHFYLIFDKNQKPRAKINKLNNKMEFYEYTVNGNSILPRLDIQLKNRELAGWQKRKCLIKILEYKSPVSFDIDAVTILSFRLEFMK